MSRVRKAKIVRHNKITDEYLVHHGRVSFWIPAVELDEIVAAIKAAKAEK